VLVIIPASEKTTGSHLALATILRYHSRSHICITAGKLLMNSYTDHSF
jgi:hypothetical protein